MTNTFINIESAHKSTRVVPFEEGKQTVVITHFEDNWTPSAKLGSRAVLSFQRKDGKLTESRTFAELRNNGAGQKVALKEVVSLYFGNRDDWMFYANFANPIAKKYKQINSMDNPEDILNFLIGKPITVWFLRNPQGYLQAYYSEEKYNEQYRKFHPNTASKGGALTGDLF